MDFFPRSRNMYHVEKVETRVGVSWISWKPILETLLLHPTPVPAPQRRPGDGRCSRQKKIKSQAHLTWHPIDLNRMHAKQPPLFHFTKSHNFQEMLQPQLQRHYQIDVACRELDIKCPLLLGTKASGLISRVIQALADQGYTKPFWCREQWRHHLFISSHPSSSFSLFAYANSTAMRGALLYLWGQKHFLWSASSRPGAPQPPILPAPLW